MYLDAPLPPSTYGGSQIPFLSGQMVASPLFVFTLRRPRDLDRGRIPLSSGGGPGPLNRSATPSDQLPAVSEKLLTAY